MTYRQNPTAMVGRNTSTGILGIDSASVTSFTAGGTGVRKSFRCHIIRHVTDISRTYIEDESARTSPKPALSSFQYLRNSFPSDLLETEYFRPRSRSRDDPIILFKDTESTLQGLDDGSWM